MDLRRVALVLKDLQAPSWRLDQVRLAVFRQSVSSYEEIDVLPLELRQGLARSAPLLSVAEREVLVGDDGRSRKAVLALADAREVETVLLRPSPRRWTTCISCQVGCAFACAFCATGKMGFVRHLSAEEICDQVLFWRQHMRREALPGRLDNVVYMGMGEPLANYENVAESLRVLMDQRQYAIGARHIAVSTVGLPGGIERFGADFPQINLAISLHAAEEDLRSKLIPANKAYSLKQIAQSLEKYLVHSSRKVFLEYVLLEGVNDRPADAQGLVAYVRGLGHPGLFHVNLILYNATSAPFRSTPEAQARRFQQILLDAGLKATVRQNLGASIRGACGQLISEER